MPLQGATRALLLALALGVSGCIAGMAQTAPPAPATTPAKPAQDDNPFPDEAAKDAIHDAIHDTTQSPPATGKAQASGSANPAPSSDNPFPEDSDAPVVRPGAGTGNDSASPQSGATRGLDPDGDPVRSPDPAGSGGDDGFSSSRSAMDHIPMEDTTEAQPGKSTKNKTREQVLKEDLDVGGFYLDQRNWKAAQGRFAAAFALDSENEDAVWGLARAERELHLNKEAMEHLKLFLTYDPDGPHSRAARKLLEQLQDGLALPTAASSSAGTNGLSPKLP